jgi:hypothetical protein
LYFRPRIAAGIITTLLAITATLPAAAVAAGHYGWPAGYRRPQLPAGWPGCWLAGLAGCMAAAGPPPAGPAAINIGWLVGY